MCQILVNFIQLSTNSEVSRVHQVRSCVTYMKVTFFIDFRKSQFNQHLVLIGNMTITNVSPLILKKD